MNKGNIYYIMIGATGDLQQEVSACREMMNRWNDLNSFDTKSVILPFHWSTSVYPNIGHSPQDVINNQIVKDSDALICILKNRIGSPTPDYESGCIEEIELHRKSGKTVMLFFINDENHPHDDQDSRLIEYKKRFGAQALYVETTPSNIKNVIFDKLSLLMHKINSQPSVIADLLKPIRETQDDAITLIKKYVQSSELYYYDKSCLENINNLIVHEETTEDSINYDRGFSDNEFKQIMMLASKFGLSIFDFDLIRRDNYDIIFYKKAPKYYVQVMRYSLSRQGWRDFSFDFFLSGEKSDKSHLYLTCGDLQDVLQLFKYWFITLREFNDTALINP